MPFYNKYAIPPISFNPQSRSHHLSPFEPYFDSYFELPNSIHDDNSSTLHVSVPSIPINSHDPNTMPSQPVSITPASVADIPSLLDLFNLSFASSSIAQLEFPTGIPSEMRQHLGSEFEKAIENPDTHVLKMMTGDEESFTYRERSNQKFDEEHPKDEEAGKAPVIGQDGKRTETGKGKIIACAVWEQVKGKTEQEWDEEEKKKLKEPIFYRDIELALIIRRAITPSKRRAMRQQDFWELSALFTHPQHERQGHGSKMLEWGLSRSSKTGVPTYIVASEAGAKLYKKHGFEELDSVTLDLGRWGGKGTYSNLFMIRQPEMS